MITFSSSVHCHYIEHRKCFPAQKLLTYCSLIAHFRGIATDNTSLFVVIFFINVSFCISFCVITHSERQCFYDKAAMARRIHDRTPTMHGSVVMYRILRGCKWTTSQWARYLGLTNQGMLRIFNVLESEHEYVITQNEDKQWVLLENGEPV
jgi:hypothetical protein